MIKLSQLQWNKIVEHTLQEHPNEMCGVITEDDFIPITNVSETPDKSFVMASTEIAPLQNKGMVKAIIHSHCRDKKTPEVFDLRTPSRTDIDFANFCKIPSLIVSCEGITVTQPIELPRIKSDNYLGRRFMWFINDCYTLVQDYYHFELGITLADHEATTDYAEVRIANNLFDPFVQQWGFVEQKSLEGLKNGDLLLLDHAGFKRNHLGVFHNNTVLHQGMISVAEPFSTFIGRINSVLKYVG